MKIFEWIEEEAAALVVAAIAALVGAIGALLLTLLVGAKLVGGELGTWFGIMPGLPIGPIAGMTSSSSFF
jgi:hypothetical protein